MNNSDQLDSQSNSIEQDLIKKEDNSKKKELSEERINFFRVINTFKLYGAYSREKLLDKLKYFETLPNHHQVFMNIN